MSQKDKSSLGLSLPQSRTVRGYEIARAPLGQFLRAVQQAQEFPELLLEAVFPGRSLREAFLELKACNGEMLGQIIARALSVVPEQVIQLIAGLTAIPEDQLKSDPMIGLDGLAEILDAWLEVNRIENFTMAAAGLWQRLRGGKAGGINTGSSV